MSLASSMMAQAQQLAWTALSASGGPPALDSSSLVYDHSSNRLIAFGGVAGSPCCTSFNNVWILTNPNGLGGPAAWIELSPAIPNGAPQHAADKAQSTTARTTS